MNFAVILAGGKGSRMNSAITKQRMNLCGHPVIWHSVKAFDSCPDVDKIVVVARTDELDYMRSALSGFEKLYKIVSGGKTRAESSYNGLLSLPEECDIVAIHDAARCLITPDGISRIIREAGAFGAATAATALTDTIKQVSEAGLITGTVDRGGLCAVQTPQAFNYGGIMKAFASVDVSDPFITDDNVVYERAGGCVRTVDVGRDNLKITEARDLVLAELILKERENV